MANVQDIYSGIISPNGGIYQPGAQVVMPSDVSRVTPEGLNVRSVNTVPVDAYGNPVDPVSAALAATNIEPNGFTNNNKAQDQLSTPGQAFAYGNGSPITPAQQAIADALVSTSTSGPSRRYHAPPHGDPGEVDWAVANPGMTQKPLIGPAVPYAAAPSTRVTDLHSRLMAQQKPDNLKMEMPYQLALSTAALKNHMTVPQIKAQLKAQQHGNKASQIYAFLNNNRNDSSGRSSDMSGFGVNVSSGQGLAEGMMNQAEQERRNQLAAQGY